MPEIHDLADQLKHAQTAEPVEEAPKDATEGGAAAGTDPPPADPQDPGPQPGDAGRPPRHDRPRGEIWKDCPVRPLGVNGDLFFYLDRLGQMRAVKKHEGQAMMGVGPAELMSLMESQDVR